MLILKLEHGWLVMEDNQVYAGSCIPNKKWAFTTLAEALKFLEGNIEKFFADRQHKGAP